MGDYPLVLQARYLRPGGGKHLCKITQLWPRAAWARGGLLFRSVATRHPREIVAIVMILHMMRPEYIYGKV